MTTPKTAPKKAPVKRAPKKVATVKLTKSPVTSQPKEKVAEQVILDQHKEEFQGAIETVPAAPTKQEKSVEKYNLKQIKEEQRRLREIAKTLRTEAKAKRKTSTGSRGARLEANTNIKAAKLLIRKALGQLGASMKSGNVEEIRNIQSVVETQTKIITDNMANFADKVDNLEEL